ncbi:Nitrogenase-stabilizing/protective protein nifW [Methylacidiphilum fumariolicum SolV]|uniref:Nitrogenase-stabilizing/protective protein NifW n=3 Tax=Candidatus Methylacidiphilum fumarolicum TaxID=591154 RepID=I0JYP9_METFB|nr:Nitrogenase-stabilizing/protective protein nifW [Methylacidiphilum fumariolicum SolV]
MITAKMNSERTGSAMAEAILKQMEKLEAAEDFFKLFEVPYDLRVLRVYRLHILQRFHDYIAAASLDISSKTDEEIKQSYAELLARAYEDFVHSNAQNEKVFKVFKEQGNPPPQKAIQFVSIDTLVGKEKLKRKTQ